MMGNTGSSGHTRSQSRLTMRHSVPPTHSLPGLVVAFTRRSVSHFLYSEIRFRCASFALASLPPHLREAPGPRIPRHPLSLREMPYAVQGGHHHRERALACMAQCP